MSLMSRWTPTARRELEVHLEGVRRSLIESGADPDEVVDDLRRHLAEEAEAARLSVVTEADVRRLVARVAPAEGGVAFSGGREGEGEGEAMPERAGRISRGGAWLEGLKVAALAFFGVGLPILALAVEWVTRSCAREFFDPLPTPWHVLMVSLVPLAHAWALVGGRGTGERGRRWRWWLNGAAVGVSAAYVVAFLSLTPMALVGVIFGLGLLPLSPWLSLAAGLVLRRRLRLAAGDGGRLPVQPWWTSFLALAGAALVLAAPALVTRHWTRLAVGEDAQRAASAVRWLRAWGDRAVLLRDCYGYRSDLRAHLFAKPLSEDEARQVYFRVTGEPFNAQPPPETARSRRNRPLMEEFAFGPEEADSGLGGESVAGRVSGLWLKQSRIDAVADADAWWSYTEWTLEFANDHPRLAREARVQIQLPPGGVVSRATLWVNGEEREAAFAGRARVREAYQKVAVAEKRDPLLVTTCGPDRVLVQAFPVPSRGGSMRIRLGVTAPLVPLGTNESVVLWPHFLERNFGLSDGLRHGIWLETTNRVIADPRDLMRAPDDQGRQGLHGQWSDRQLSDPRHAVRLGRDPSITGVWALDRRSESGGLVRQRLVATGPDQPPRLAVVADASIGMDEGLRALAEALEEAPPGGEVRVFAASDLRWPVGVSAGGGSRVAAAAAQVVRGLETEGGQDSVPALVEAWDWVAESRGGVVLWVHGPQPVLVRGMDGLRQRLEWRNGGSAPRLLGFQVRPGPNRVVEGLDGLAAYGSVPRWGSAEEDLRRLLSSWADRERSWVLRREHVADEASGGATDRPTAGHVTRLWAAGEAGRLMGERQWPAATELAARHQLVTAASGAVVLETQDQYTQAGLRPVDPASVPVVPEPDTVLLWILGGAVLGWAERRRSRRREGIHGLAPLGGPPP